MKKIAKFAFIILAAFTVVLLCVLVAVPFLTTNSMLDIRLEYEYIDPANHGIESEQIALQTDDNLSIASYFVQADNPQGTVVLVSGIHNPPVCSFYSYAKMFQDIGFSTLLIEMRSHGQSEGFGISAGYNEWLDVKAGVDFILSLAEYKNLPIVAYGTSMGASTVLIAAAQVEGIDGVISASAYSKWSDVAYYTMREQMGAPAGYSLLQKPFFDLHLGLKYGLDKMKYSPINQIEDIDIPILLMHSTGDTQVPFTCYEKLLDAAKDNLQVYTYTLEGDYHFICREDFDITPIADEKFSEAVCKFLCLFT